MRASGSFEDIFLYLFVVSFLVFLWVMHYSYKVFKRKYDEFHATPFIDDRSDRSSID